MSSQLIQSLSNSPSVSSAFIQSVSSIKNYCHWIISQSVADATLNNALLIIRNDATKWYDIINPEYLNLPSGIIAASGQINGNLDMLILLADQEMQSGNPPAIQEQISQYAHSLIATIQSLLTQIQALVAAMSVFQTNISRDTETLINMNHSVNRNLSFQEMQLSEAYGKLHALEHATCTNRNYINACREHIAILNNEKQRLLFAFSVFRQASDMAREASLGTSYLNNYWQHMVTDIQSCITSLHNIANESGALLKADLTFNQFNWNALERSLLEIVQQVTSI